MEIRTTLLPTPDLANSDVDIAVVIDVLRATSVMTTALRADAASITTFGDIDSAVRFADSQTPRPLLCGERHGRRIDGFDLGNSPAEYTPERVRGRDLALTTTNGTRAIELAAPATEIVAASFLNLSAIVRHLQTADTIHLICAGTNRKTSADDVLLAGTLAVRCVRDYSAVVADDDTAIAMGFWRDGFGEVTPSTGDLVKRLRETRGGLNVINAGFEPDIERCARIDSVHLIPRLSSRDPMTFRRHAGRL